MVSENHMPRAAVAQWILSARATVDRVTSDH